MKYKAEVNFPESEGFSTCALTASRRTYTATLVVCGETRNCLRENVVGMNFSTHEVHMRTNCRDKKRVR